MPPINLPIIVAETSPFVYNMSVQIETHNVSAVWWRRWARVSVQIASIDDEEVAVW
jgi:hypothetical protein